MKTFSLTTARKIVTGGLPNRLPHLTRNQPPSLGPVLVFVKTLDHCFARLNEAAGVDPRYELIVREASLHEGFATLMTYLYDLKTAPESLIATWSRTRNLLVRPRPKSFDLDIPSIRLSPAVRSEELHEYLTVYNAALAEVLREHETEPRARQTLRELLERLGLSYDDLAQAFDVSGETVRRWEKGAARVPVKKFALLEAADQALRRLLRIFRPDRLASVIRRPAPLFDGASAFEWIRHGRIREVADRFETAFQYQG